MNWLKRFEAMSEHHHNFVTSLKAFIINLYAVGAGFAYAPYHWFWVTTLAIMCFVQFALLLVVLLNILNIVDGYEGWLPKEKTE